MGTRYFISVVCPTCHHTDNDVYYAPTCGFTTWRCPKCHDDVDIAWYTGITKEDASNAAIMEKRFGAGREKP